MESVSVHILHACGRRSFYDRKNGFQRKRYPGLERAIVVNAETSHYTVSLNYSIKRSLIYTHPEDKYNTLFENTHKEET
jgi:hypothetical protein